MRYDEYMQSAQRLLLFAAAVFLSAGKIAASDLEIRTRELPSFSPSVLTLDIRTNVSAAEIYLNNVFKGNAPLVLENTVPGSYILRIEKKGYYTQEFECDFEGGTKYIILAQLEAITGVLHVRVDEPGAELYVDGNKTGETFRCFSLGSAKPPQAKNASYTYSEQNGESGCEWTLKVSEGSHTVEVKKFGKKSESANVYVFRGTSVNLDFHLQDADFELTSFSAGKKRFNPYNPGALGLCRFYFSVTAEGDGELEIYDASDRIIYRRRVGPFTRENQECPWDGRAENGEVVKDGTYTARIKARGETGVQGGESLSFSATKEIPVTIDRSLFYPLIAAAADGSASGTVPSVRLMPKGGIYCAFSAGGGFSFGGTKGGSQTVPQGFISAPLFYSFAYTPLRFLELSCGIGTEIRPSSQSPFIVQAAAKLSRNAKPFYYGFLVRYGYSSKPASALFNETGLSLGAAAAAEIGPVCITAAEEAIFGDERGIINALAGKLKTGLLCAFQRDFYALHLSAAFLVPFSEKGVHRSASGYCGAEFSCLIPRTTCMPFAGLYYTYASSTSGIGFRIGTAIFL